MYCRCPLKDLHAAFCEHGCFLFALRNPDILCFTEILLTIFLVMFQNHFTLGNEKKNEGT